MPKQKPIFTRVGVNFLAPHPRMQEQKFLNKEEFEKHVIVDRKDWELVVKFFNEYPDQFDKMINDEGKAGDNEMEITL